MLLDSNILIYAFQQENAFLLSYLNEEHFVSAISKLEVLGYHKLGSNEKQAFELLFRNINVINVDMEIIEKAITIRQKRSMSLADSIIAATAMVNDLKIITRNTKDYVHIEGLQVMDPFEV